VPAKIVTPDSRQVYYHKFCPTDGISENWVHGDLVTYLETQRYVKPAWTPEYLSGQSDISCPYGCGFCDRHEQHLCMPIVEITSRCDLACPICIANAGKNWDMTVEEFGMLVDKLISAERQIDVLNFSGGEPLLHPQLLKIIDEALSRPEIVRVSISTNGLSLLRNPKLVAELYDRNIVVALQFDGFDDNAYEVLRGRKLLKAKLDILDMLSEVGISTSLTFTAANDINTDQLARTVEYLFSNPHVISMMIQPLSFAGRASRFSGRINRLTVADVVRLLSETAEMYVKASDFVPLTAPCQSKKQVIAYPEI